MIAPAPAVAVNPGRRSGPVPGAPDASPTAFHQRLPGYAPGPLLDAPGLAAEMGLAQVWVKDETHRFGLPAFKLLGASWAVYRTLCARLGAEPAWADLSELAAAFAPLRRLRLVTATDGNHGRAVARAAAWFGLDAAVWVPAGTAAARVDAIAAEGAQVTVVDGSYEDAVAAASAAASDRSLVISDTSWPGYHDVPALVAQGYRTIFAEADQELARLGQAGPDLVLVQTGVGALAVAAVHHHRRVDGPQPPPLLAIVEPTTADCVTRSCLAGEPVLVPGPHPSIMAGLNCGAVSEIAWPVLRAGTDLLVTVDDAAAERAMRDLHGLGLVAGETGAAGLAGLRVLAEAGSPLPLAAGGRALVICTEGATDPVAYRRIVGVDP